MYFLVFAAEDDADPFSFCIEMFLTCFLCFTVVMTAVVSHSQISCCVSVSQRKEDILTEEFGEQEKNKATHICALAIGAALFSTQLLALNLTSAGVNPARAFGAEVIAGFESYHWIYVSFLSF